MKVVLHYEDNENKDLHKSLRITLPKSWKTGPASKLLNTFVESYNASELLGKANPLTETELHLAVRVKSITATSSDDKTLVPLASDAVIVDVIADREDVYVLHGASQTLGEIEEEKRAEEERKRIERETLSTCTHFGCKKRFPKGGPYPECQYHASPPIFHETAKFWSCCPNKKAYDWNEFESIPGCLHGTCSEVKDEQKLFLGGSDLREQVGEAKLKSIDDFNKSEAAGGSEAAPVLDQLRTVMAKVGVENDLYDQVLDGLKRELSASASNEAELLEAVSNELGQKLKDAMKAIATEQQRIK